MKPALRDTDWEEGAGNRSAWGGTWSAVTRPTEIMSLQALADRGHCGVRAVQSRGRKTPDGGKQESGWMYIWVGKLFERRNGCGRHTDEKEELKGGGNEGALLWRVLLGPFFSSLWWGKRIQQPRLPR